MSPFPIILAQAAPSQGGPEPSIAPTIMMFGMLFAIMYFLLWRPQKKKEEERQELLKRVKKNDHVITSGGIHGIVTSVKDDEVTLKVDESNNVKIRFTRGAIATIVGEGEGAQQPPTEPPK